MGVRVSVQAGALSTSRLALPRRRRGGSLAGRSGLLLLVVGFGLCALPPTTLAQRVAAGDPGPPNHTSNRPGTPPEGPAVADGRTISLVVVQDGPSPLLDRAAASIRQEATALFGTRTSITVVTGSHTQQSVRALLAHALSDLAAPDHAGGVITLGPLAAEAATAQPELTTPVVAVLGGPRAVHGVDPTDARPLLFRGPGLTFQADLERLRELAPDLTRVAVPITPEIARALPGLAAYLAGRGQAYGMTITPYPLPPPSAGDPLANLQADALYLGLPLDPRIGGTRRLLSAAADHKLPVVAGLSDADVARGALLSTLWPRQYRLWARSAVLGVQALLEGNNASALRSAAVAQDKALPSRHARAESHRLVLNRRLVKTLGLTPSFALLRDAEQGAAATAGEPISLEQAVARALSANQTLEAERHGLVSGQARVKGARGPLLPQATLSANANWIDQDRGATPFPPAERTVTVGGKVTQTVYSARQFGDYSVEAGRQQARERSYEAARLDTIQEVAERYIELLRARDLEAVMFKSVENARINLTLAEGRHRAGDVGREEVYRWRISLSSSQQGLVRAQSRRRQAEAGLNEIQNQPLGTSLYPDEQRHAGLRMLATDARLGRYFERPDRLDRLTAFAVTEAKQSAPELAAAQAEVVAAERAYDRALRALWLPELFLQASVADRVWNGGAGTGPRPTVSGLRVPDNLDWTLGVTASFPLFAGLSDDAEVSEARAEMKRARAEAAALSLALERRVHNALAEASAAHQALSLATEAAQDAQKGMDLVREGYARGAVDVLRLVDAQSQVVVTDLAVENAYHDFLAAFVLVERALGRFSFGPSARTSDDFLAALLRHPAPTRSKMESP